MLVPHPAFPYWQLAALLQVKKRAVRMAPDAVVKEVTGFPSGEQQQHRSQVDGRLLWW
jgi:hypothetical protein